MFLTFLYVFSFLSFNTKAMMPNDARLEDTAALVRESGADFAFLTEEYTGQLADLLREDYPYAQSARSHIDVTERFYSKYPIVDVKDIGAVPSGDKVDVWVHRVRVVPAPGDTLSLYCCHLPHGYEERVGIVGAILEDIAGTGGEAVVGGDMNSLAVSAPMTMLSRGGLKDTWLEKGRGSGGTFYGYGFGIRIDFIFHSAGLEPQRMCRIPASAISDHDALWAEYERK